MNRPILLAVTSDQHACSTLGLCPPEGVRFDDGGRYDPSKVQRWLWENWLDFWKHVGKVRDQSKARLICVYNGDATDGGAHHGTTQTISSDPEVQGYVAERVFSVPRDLKPHKSYMVRGTAIHVGGDSAPAETALAKHLRCERDPESDSWASWHLRLNVYGRIMDFQHHGRMGSRPWTKQNVVTALAGHIWMEHKLANLPAPDVAFRSHQHVKGDSYNAFPTRVIQTPAWQCKTAFVHRIGPESISDLGGVLCLVQPNGDYEITFRLYQPELPELRPL
jgi:hypothetical protein